MIYDALITNGCKETIDSNVYYLIEKLKNPLAAEHLLDEIDSTLARVKENPFQFSLVNDFFLSNKGYRDAHLSSMNYKLIFRIEGNTIYIVGLFHELEQYWTKVFE